MKNSAAPSYVKPRANNHTPSATQNPTLTRLSNEVWSNSEFGHKGCLSFASIKIFLRFLGEDPRLAPQHFGFELAPLLELRPPQDPRRLVKPDPAFFLLVEDPFLVRQLVRRPPQQGG